MSSERTNLNTFCHAYAEVVRRGAFPKVTKPADRDDTLKFALCDWLAGRAYAARFGLRFTRKLPAMDGESERITRAHISAMYWSGTITADERDAANEAALAALPAERRAELEGDYL